MTTQTQTIRPVCKLCRGPKGGDGYHCAACVRALYAVSVLRAEQERYEGDRGLDAAALARRAERLKRYAERAARKQPVCDERE